MKSSKPVVLVMIGILAVSFFAFDLHHHLSLGSLKQNLQSFQAYQQAHPMAAISIYMATYIVVTALSLPGAGILTLVGGAIFGLFKGVIIVSFASTIGATLAFLMARFLFRDAIQRRFKEKLEIIDQGVEKEGGFYLFSLRLVPLFPFFILNILMGLTRIPTLTYALVSQVGMLPATVVFVNAGKHLAELESIQGILSPGLMATFAILGIFPIAAKKSMDLIRHGKAMRAYDKPKKFDYNLVVIGAGSAGLVASYIASAVKARVALIERDKMGGDCLNTGCVPSKALIKSGHVLSLIRRAKDFGFDRGEMQFDFARVMKRVHDTVAAVAPHDSVARYTDLGVDCIQGEATILSPYRVKITPSPHGSDTNGTMNLKRSTPPPSPDASETKNDFGNEESSILTTRNIIIATGARPLIPNLPGLEKIPYYTSDTIWNLQKCPKRLLVLGGGPIGCELAQAFSNLGAKVTLVQRGDRLMKREDPEVSQLIKKTFETQGITVLTGHTAKKFLEPAMDPPHGSGFNDHHGRPSPSTTHENAGADYYPPLNRANNNLPLHIQTNGLPDASSQKGGNDEAPQYQLICTQKKGESHETEITVPFDTLLMALGRTPNVTGLGLEALGIPLTNKGTIDHGPFLETSIPNIFCAGDVAGPYQFTHTAAHQSWFASINALFGSIKKFRVDYRTIPWATFTHPEVARVGLNESDAKKQKIPYEVTRYDIDDLDRAIADSEARGFVKVLTPPGKDKILGVTIVGNHAGDIIAEFILAMKHGLGLNKILGTIHIYPTMAEANKYAAGQWKRAHAPEKILIWIEKFHNWLRN